MGTLNSITLFFLFSHIFIFFDVVINLNVSLEKFANLSSYKGERGGAL